MQNQNLAFIAFLTFFSVLGGGVACVAHTSPQSPSNSVLDAIQSIDALYAQSVPQGVVTVVHEEVEINGVSQNS